MIDLSIKRVIKIGSYIWFICAALSVWRVCLPISWDTDLMNLLPDSAVRHVALSVQSRHKRLTREVIVAIGTDNVKLSQKLAIQSQQDLEKVGLAPTSWIGNAQWEQLVEGYRPHRQGFLTIQQRDRISNTSSEVLLNAALARLYQPMSRTILPWREDPFGFWPDWWQQQSLSSDIVADAMGRLQIHKDGIYWNISLYQADVDAFKIHESSQLRRTLDNLRKYLPVHGQLIYGGFPIHAESAARQAKFEINAIGWGSLIGVLILTWCAFGSLRPLLGVGLSLLVGCVTGLAVTTWIFGSVHLLTLVFGSTLVGVAEDFGIHYFAHRQGHLIRDKWDMLRKQIPSMSLAMLTSIVGYLGMGIAPFPGLRQMAVFSAVGIASAWMTVIFWIPWLDTKEIEKTKVALRIEKSLDIWPQATWKLITICLAFCAWGLANVELGDDVRLLQRVDTDLVAQQVQLNDLLHLPNTVPYIEVCSENIENILIQEETLSQRLPSGLTLQSLSRWLPSTAEQKRNIDLVSGLERQVLERAGAVPIVEQTYMKPDVWRELTKSIEFLDSYWPSHHCSIAQIQGTLTPALVEQLEKDIVDLQGVRLVNPVAEISKVMRSYREVMSYVLLIGVVVVTLMVAMRFGLRAWRAVVPTVLSMGLAVACVSLLGQPLHLFEILALCLVLGIGIDYGIFLLETHNQASAWVAVVVGALSTWLSFGLLGLSQTPALRIFGLTTFFGVGFVALLAPCFRHRHVQDGIDPPI